MISAINRQIEEVNRRLTIDGNLKCWSLTDNLAWQSRLWLPMYFVFRC